MKKVLAGTLVIIMLTLFSLPAYGASGTPIKVDGVTIVSDVQPEVVNQRVMVPLRIFSENLGASVSWSNSEVTIAMDQLKITLKPNSHAAVRNGSAVTLDVKPYVKNERVFVPLRFIAETFGCQVQYRDGLVSVATEPLVIDGSSVYTLQHEIHMTMGGIVTQMKGNAYIKAIYDLFEKGKGEPTEAPAHYTWTYPIMDTGWYGKATQFDFLDMSGTSVQRFDLYTLYNDSSNVLLYDASADKWYKFGSDDRNDISKTFGLAGQNGFTTVISDTVV
ncbi:copper amine oxidase N-terminal domain-containing protein [Cohnella sp. AR92]|uniref:copper amine oxidase N-terminal domain-containing protein n=1 Tax=Cohnella sp. AR92 TaxID=648716 RepID=UPI000F8CB2D6|nr:copper amine oxidase N-terminal domain-containing protein [Cohnella sp. AR92]RUS46247.1 copper amine oxidase N-terminal domain-containing protein [Cohnella sp. AR92]